MRSFSLILLLAGCMAAQAQNSNPSAPSKSQTPDPASASKPPTTRTPSLAPPRSDRVDATSLGDEPGDSSSKDTRIDLSPPPDDSKAHPESSKMLADEGTGDVGEFHPWDPHKAAKDIEVGDFYFKKKNYKAAEDRYREALLYKQNDALATFRLAVCLEKMDRLDEARSEYDGYLKILPSGPLAPDAKKALERLNGPAANAKPAQ